MATPITTGALSNLLLDWLYGTWQAGMKDWDPFYSQFMTIEKSKHAFEQHQETITFGLAAKKAEGSPVIYQGTQQGYLQVIQNITYALGFIVTREMQEDDRYAFINKLPAGLARSMKQTIEIICANIALNNAFNSSYTIYDGKTLLATDHPLATGGTFSNTFATAQDLSENALAAAVSQITRYKDARGLVAKVLPEMLIVPPELEQRARKLVFSTLEPESGNNAVNYVALKGMFPKGIQVNPYTIYSDAWYIKTDQEGLIFQDRRSPEITRDNEFDSENLKVKTTARFGVGITDPRAIFGSAGVNGPTAI